MASSSQAHALITDLLSVPSLNATNLRTDQSLEGFTPTETVNADNNSGAMSTSQLVGVIAASLVVVLAVFILICVRRRRYVLELSTPTICSAFQGVTLVTPSDHISNAFRASTASTGTATPQPSPRQTSKSQPIPTEKVVGLHVAQDESIHEILPTERVSQPARTTSLVSGRSLFLASFLMRDGFRSSLPAFAAFKSSRASQGGKASSKNEHYVTKSSGPTQIATSRKVSVLTPIEHRNTESGAWGDFSDTNWSIGLDSDSETESKRFTLPAESTYGGAFVSHRNRLSTLSDKILDVEEAKRDFDFSFLDDSSCRHNCDSSMMSNSSPPSKQGNAAFDDSSPRQVRGLSALDGRWKANSIDESGTNKSGCSFFSNDSDFNSGCSLISFESDYGSNSDGGSLQEEEF